MGGAPGRLGGQIGILIGARSALTFFLAIHGGALMDRLGTRRVMMFFAAATGGLAALHLLPPWFPAMTAMQMLIGFAGNMAWMGAQTILGGIYALPALAHALRRGFEGIVQPLMFSTQARSVPADLQGSVAGPRVTNNRMSSIVTPIVMNLIVERFGIADGFVVMGAIPLTACGFLALALMLSPALGNREGKS